MTAPAFLLRESCQRAVEKIPNMTDPAPVTDHLIDHLTEIAARLAGRALQPDEWRASAITTAADLASFTDQDLDEARSRLRRLTLIWAVRLRSLTREQLDTRADEAWTPSGHPLATSSS
jgi:hypothetical protein